jgi:hypothetical protein
MALTDAAEFYIARRETNCCPPGGPDEGRLWWLGDLARERQACCDGIHTFARNFITHCRSFRHVAALCGVDERELMKMVKQIDRQRENNIPCHVREM